MGTFIKDFKCDDWVRWAKVQLQSGDPIWISVASVGVIVKRSKVGILGKKLFDGNLGVSFKKSEALLITFPNPLTPFGMDDPVLKAFTNAVLHCSNLQEVEQALSGSILDDTRITGLSGSNFP